MADTTFVDKVTGIIVAWCQAINDFVYKGRNPNFATTTGSANAQVLTLPSTSLYTSTSDGDRFSFIAGFTNTGAATLAIKVNGSTIASLNFKFNGAALVSNEIIAGTVYDFIIVGTNAVLLKDGAHQSVIDVSKSPYNATGDGATDDTAAFLAAYAAAKAAKRTLLIPVGTYKVTAQLLWDGSVDVMGGGEFAVINAYGNFDVVKIAGAAQESTYRSFSVNRGSGTGNGIWVNDAAHAVFESVKTRGHAGYGWYLYNATTATGFFTNYINCSAALSGIDGWYINNHWRSNFISTEADVNTGWGFNFVLGDYHTGVNTQSQGNTAGGYQIATNQNNFDIYGENNTGPDLYLTATSNHNNNTIVNITTYPDDLDDRGTDNTQIAMSGVIGVSTRRITRPKRTTNVAGLPVSLLGGAAGAGASANPGGAASVIGGDAGGTGNSDGGIAVVRGGDGVGTGRNGTIQLQSGNGPIVIGSTTEPVNPSVCLQFNSVTSVPLMPKLTTTQKNALTIVNGMGPIFDTTLGKVQVVEGAAWVSII